jgi:hypothetical protein
VTAAIVLAGVLGGCGGSSALSHSALVSQSNAICHFKNTQVAALGKPTTVSALETALAHGITIAEQAHAKLQALKPPSSDAAAFAAMLSLDSQTLAVDRQAVQALAAHNLTSFRTLLQHAVALSTQARAKAAQVGLTDCSHPT